MIFTIAKGAPFPIGGHTVVLNEDAEFDFVDAPSMDGVAEILSTDPKLYAANLEALSHDEDTEHGKVGVTYGAAGVRVEGEPLSEEKKSKKKK